MNFRCRVLKSKSGGPSLLLTVPKVLMVPVNRPTSQHLRCTAAVLMSPLKIPYKGERDVLNVVFGEGEFSLVDPSGHIGGSGKLKTQI